MLVLILFILAAVCFILAAARIASSRVEFIALGLFFWLVAAELAPKL